MAFELSEVMPWGRSFDEYAAMFALTEADLAGRILGCGDGPASFNAEATRRGHRVISADPVYRFTAEQLQSRIEATTDVIAEQTRRNADEFVWKHFRSVEELISARMAAMRDFLADFPAGLHEGRYIDATVSRLPFADRQFDLALCSHFLFLYSEQHGLDFHIAAVLELCRTAREVRIFPLLELGSVESRHAKPVTDAMARYGYRAKRVRVPYEFQKGGNEMLRIVASDDNGEAT